MAKICNDHMNVVIKSGAPRLGDKIYKCSGCDKISHLYANKITLRLFREEEVKNSKTIVGICKTCRYNGYMILEEGPTIIKNWKIATCVPCGQRVDIW